MNDLNIQNQPVLYAEILQKTSEIGFTMPSDLQTGAFLTTLASSKPKSRMLELGTGTGLSLCWLLNGMDDKSTIISIDNNPELTSLASGFFQKDHRVEVICADGSSWLKNYRGCKFDLIFADAWPGKYSELNEALDLLNPGGLYLIDDMLPQPNWPEGHQRNVDELVNFLENRSDLNITKFNWSTGLLLASKK